MPGLLGNLDGAIVLITGTGGGQGAVAAELFREAGAVVIGCDISPTDGSEPVDLTDEDAVRRWVHAAAATHGRIDALYANAGATRFSPVESTSAEDWNFVLRHELNVVFFPVKHAWPYLRQSGRGAIVLVGSTAGFTGSLTNSRVAHTVTKGGIVALTKQLAAEGAAHGIRANCVSPGMIETPATRSDLLAHDHPMYRIAQAIPLRRVGQPEEVARCALFLCSTDASYVTGAHLVIDGGWSAVLPGAELLAQD